MKANIEARQITAFVDGGARPRDAVEIEQRMRVDAELREKIEGLRQLKATIREHADYHELPAALRERLGTWIAAPVAKPATPSRAAVLIQRWWGWRPIAASLALVGVGALTQNLVTLQLTQDDRLVDEVVASHVRSTLGQHLVDVASSDHHTVKPWLSSRLDFSPPVQRAPLRRLRVPRRPSRLPERPTGRRARVPQGPAHSSTRSSGRAPAKTARQTSRSSAASRRRAGRRVR
jgi:anti-sigma factor RsiW